MALKRRQKISPSFSMSSMTDLIFLLLIFFMITSTMVSPNAIKVLLPARFGADFGQTHGTGDYR